MPDETFNEILGNNPPGKAVAGMAPELQQQSAPVTGAGMKTSGTTSDNTQNNTREPLEPVTAAPTPKATQQNPSTINPQQPQSMTYTEMIQRLSPYVPPTPEELEKERKREKQKRLWAAIGDGIAAFSNLYFASKSGISNYKSMSKPLNERLDKIREEREKNNQRYLSLYMSARQQDDAADRWKRDFEYRAEQDKSRNEESARRWQEQFDYQKGRDDVADERYAAEQERKAAADERAATLNDAQIKTELSRQSANYALANQRNAAAKNGGSGRGSKKYTLQIGDETKEYGSVTDYNRDVEAYAEYYGIDLYVYEGSGLRQKQKRKPTAQLAAEVERASGVTKDGPRPADDDDFESYRTDTEDDFEQYRQN